jgi:hypothetical protein
MNLLNSRGIVFEGSIISPTLAGTNAIVDRRFIEGVPYQNAEEFADWEIFSYALAREPAQNIVQPGALNRSSSSTSAFTGSGTTGVNMLTLPGLLYAYEADSADMVAAYTNGASVGTFHETNNTLDLTGGVTHTYLTPNGINGQPAVSFPANTSTRAFRAATNAFFGTNTQTIYTVCKPDAFVGSTGVTSLPQTVAANWNDASATAQHWGLYRQSTNRRWIYELRNATANPLTISQAYTSATDEQPTIVVARWNAGPTRIRVNAVTGTDSSLAGTFRTTSSANLTIGDYTISTYDQPFRGEIACVYIYNQAHDDATIAYVEQFLSDKYGIPL